MSSRTSESINSTIQSTFNKVGGYIFVILLGIIGWFINNKLSEIETKLQKIDLLEQRVETLNKSQIQIMTHLKVPVPDYLFGQSYIDNHIPIYPNSESVIFVKNYLVSLDEKKRKIFREKKS